MNIEKNVLSEQEAQVLITSYNHKGHNQLLDHNDVIIQKIIDKVSKYTKYPISKESTNSYFEVQTRKMGHPLHYDTGSKGHMKWCGFSTSMLLSDPKDFEGGNIWFKDEDGSNKRGVKKDEHYLSCIAYRSVEKEGKNKHVVNPHTGTRTVFLMFVELEEPEE